MRRSAQNLDFNLRRDHQKISYERRDYDSVDEKNLSWAMPRKTKNKRIHAIKGSLATLCIKRVKQIFYKIILFNPLLHEFFFSSVFENLIKPKIGCYRLPTHRCSAHIIIYYPFLF